MLERGRFPGRMKLFGLIENSQRNRLGGSSQVLYERGKVAEGV